MRSGYSRARAAGIVAAVAAGWSVDDAAEKAGVSASTVYRWQLRFPRFASNLTRARACLRGKLAEIVHDAATRGDWRAAAFILERHDPNAWGRNARIAIDGEVSVSALTMEQRVSAALAAVSQRSREEMEAVIDRAGLNRGLVRRPEGEGV